MFTWAEEAIFYHIYPLGFCGAPSMNNNMSETTSLLEMTKAWVEHMKSLSVNAIYFGPVFESLSHGYDTVDYKLIDRRIGTNKDFSDLCKLLHNNDIRVVLDGVFNHVGREFWAFKDVIENGSSSKYCNWFKNLNFSGISPYGDHFCYDSWNGCHNLVRLNLESNEVKGYLFDVVKTWVEEFDIDGIRLDCADCLDLEFLKELNTFCNRLKPDFWLMGEVVNGDGDYRKWITEDVLDSVTNYECYKGLYSSHNDLNFFEIAYSLNRQFNETNGLYKGKALYSFADNHDVNRIASTLNCASHLYTLYALLFTMPGIPSIYYGSEWGISGVKSNDSDECLRPKLDLLDVSNHSSNKDLVKAIRKFATIRKESNALKYGRYKQILVEHEQFGFARMTDEECIIVIVNANKAAVELCLDIPVSGTKVVDILNDGEVFPIQNGKCHIDAVYPSWARILKVVK
ncbi:MAG: alpha-amylase [Firmicutes bacterium HGW-Firmicutes-1]|jgi:glycosidase|nr:MAG: alpha-amylase [Firmicutes bacterium HGW-Firmicutes-1]